MTHILSNLPKEYDNTVEKLEDKFSDIIYLLPIKINKDKLLTKYNRMNVNSN